MIYPNAKTFSEAEYSSKKKLIRRDRFHTEIDQLAPRAVLEAQIAPLHADNTCRLGRPSIGLSRFLRHCVVQQRWPEQGGQRLPPYAAGSLAKDLGKPSEISAAISTKADEIQRQASSP